MRPATDETDPEARSAHTSRGAKGRRTEQAFKDAARTVIARDGYLNATIGDIAKEAGRSAGSFYNYFDNKRQLLEVLLDDFMDTLLERRGLLTAPATDSYESIHAAISAFWQTYREYRPELVGVMHAAAVDVEFMQVWVRARDVGIRNIEREITAAQLAGRFPSDIDALQAASTLSSMLEHACYLWLGMEVDALGRPPSDDAAVDLLATLWHRAIWSGPAGG